MIYLNLPFLCLSVSVSLSLSLSVSLSGLSVSVCLCLCLSLSLSLSVSVSVCLSVCLYLSIYLSLSLFLSLFLSLSRKGWSRVKRSIINSHSILAVLCKIPVFGSKKAASVESFLTVFSSFYKSVLTFTFRLFFITCQSSAVCGICCCMNQRVKPDLKQYDHSASA